MSRVAWLKSKPLVKALTSGQNQSGSGQMGGQMVVNEWSNGGPNVQWSDGGHTAIKQRSNSGQTVVKRWSNVVKQWSNVVKTVISRGWMLLVDGLEQRSN